MDKYQSALETYNNVAFLYQEKFMHLDLYNDTYDTFCSSIKKQNSKIFEIGCGPGNITRYVLSKRPDFAIEAIDFAPNMIALAKVNVPSADFKIMDCINIDQLTAKYDGIMCGFCMPYLSKEECSKLIKDCSSLLNSGGVFYFSVIEGDYNKSGYEVSSNGENKTYVYYYQEEYFQNVLKENNFDLVCLERKAYQQSEKKSSTHLIIIARKNNFLY